MAYIAINSDEITTGKPVANTTQVKIKDNFEDHESRIQSLEGGSSVEYPPIILRVNGHYGDVSAYTGVLETTCNFDITLTGIRIIISNAGTSGTTTCDVQRKRGVTAFTSLLSTLPSVAHSAGNHAVSTNGVLDPSKVNLLAGDIIRLDLTSTQVNGRGFTVRIDYTKT